MSQGDLAIEVANQEWVGYEVATSPHEAAGSTRLDLLPYDWTVSQSLAEILRTRLKGSLTFSLSRYFVLLHQNPINRIFEQVRC
jgi:hypothetical protein